MIRRIKPAFSTVARHILPRRRSDIGAKPGTIVVDPAAPQPEISAILYDSEGLDSWRIERLDDIPGPPDGKRILWLNIDGLGDAKTIFHIGKLFKFHPLALEDVVNTHQRPKAEDYKDCVFIVTRMAMIDERLRTEQVSIFLGPNFVVTFQERPGDCLEPVRERLRKKVGFIRSRGADYLAYALIDAIIDNYFPVLENYGEHIEHEEELVYEGAKGTSIVPILHLKKELFLLRKIIWPHREMLGSLQRDPYALITDQTRLYLRDCYDHAVHLLDLTETFREMVGDLRDLYLTMLSNRTNETMRVLTQVATIFIPLTFIAGLYGMNFDPDVSPYNMPELKWYYGYPFAFGLMGLSLALSLLYYVWRGWLRIDRRIFSFRRRKRDV